MIDCLLSTEDNDQCKSEMTNMLLCKDNQNKSVLSEYFSRDSELAEHFLSHHISTNGENDSSDQFLMCYDISPLKDFDEEDCLLENLRPFSSNKRKVLLHPVMTTFVMMKYNSLALVFLTILLMKFLHCIFLTCLTLTKSIQWLLMRSRIMKLKKIILKTVNHLFTVEDFGCITS